MENLSEKSHDEAEAVGRLLADAFILRVVRFPEETRRRLLIACHHRLMSEDAESATTLFKGQ